MRTRRIAFLIGLASAAPAARAETLAQATAAAMAVDPGLASARADYLASTALSSAARARGRFQLGFSSRATHDFDDDPHVPRIRDETSLRLTVPLYSGGRVREAFAAARLRAAAASLDVDSRADDLRIQIAQRYDRLLAAEDEVGIAEDEAGSLARSAAEADAEAREGASTRTDVAQAAARLAIARARREAAIGDRDEARALLTVAVGADPGRLAPPPVPEVAGDLQDLTDAALRYSPALRALGDRVRAAARDVEASRGLGRPTLSLAGKASYGNTDMLLAETRRFPHRAFAQVALTLTVPLYSGGQVAAQTARANAILREVEDYAESERRRLIADVRTGYESYRGAVGRLAAAEEARGAAERALDGVRIEHGAGTRDGLDVLNAQREFAATRREVARARHQAHLEAVALLVRTGRAMAQEGETHRAEADRPAVAALPAKLGFDLARLAGSVAVPAAHPAPAGARLPYALAALG